MKNKSIPTLEDARQYIYSIDFSQIIDKMVTRDGWLKSDALKVCSFYRNYLFLRKKYSGTLRIPPSEEIDEMWHNHILDTKKYRVDCQAIFGKFHDHYPYFGFDKKSNQQDLKKAFESVQKLYAKEFNGQKIYKVRNFYSAIIAFLKKQFVF